MSDTAPVETPKLNLAFAPLGDISPAPAVTQDEAKATADALSRLTNAPKEVREAPEKPSPEKKRGRPKAKKATEPTPEIAEKPAWRRRPGRPRSLRKHPLTLKTTEKHLKFLYALTDEGGLLVEGIEDGLNQLAAHVLEQESWRGRDLSPELIAAAKALAGG